MKRFLAILALLSLTSCVADQAFVKSVRSHYDRHVPIYRAYLNGDPVNITEAEREALLRNLESWDLVIRAEEGAR